MKAVVVAAGLLAWVVALPAGAGALEDCSLRGARATIAKCLADADGEAQAALVKAEGALGRLAREVDTATGHPVAAAALARSMREFADYRKAQCEFVRAMRADGANAEFVLQGCMVDMTRRRVRDVQN
jgi:uncharacterized protein YecT (DUF1311 family)